MKTINGIKCNVYGCVYNKNKCDCTAGKIEVGPSSACSCSETLCAIFEPKSEDATGGY